ncbi:kinase-like domain-containing protein [Schizothecium vesticola]|uniref:Kinase-like domain-containing protein n=1 Tax=Schizothecium vesticola TaxID=314040 RepID=A0AA40F990_9PEZI|nr:kinase-like domain-containing protein [Schizothecium vesticola]
MRDGGGREEFQIYGHLSQANPSHPGYRHVRAALDIFSLPRTGGDHRCLVQKPMWDSWRDLLRRNPAQRFSLPLLTAGLRHVLLALDYLHNECQLVPTDIKADNILQEIVDDLGDAVTAKFVGGTAVYRSRPFELPTEFGGAVLSDFGAAVRGDQKRNHDAQPNVYRSPEVMLKAEWSYPVDIWNAGVMIWDLFEGKHLFYGDDPDGKEYSTRAHLAELVGMLGPPPPDLIQRGIRGADFFTRDGGHPFSLPRSWKADVPIRRDTSLEKSEEYLEGRDKEDYLVFVRSMLQWRVRRIGRPRSSFSLIRGSTDEMPGLGEAEA